MKTSQKGKLFILAKEGICLSKYKDSVGVWTIGAGATSSDIPDLKDWPMDKKLTVEEVLNMFVHHLVKYENAVNKALAVDIAQHQFDALGSICYNIGTGGMTKSTFIRRINAMSPQMDISDAIKMWDKPKEIKGRRAAEARLYTQGVYGDLSINIFPVNQNGNPIYNRGTMINGNDYLDKATPPKATNKSAAASKDNAVDLSDLLDYMKSQGIGVIDSVKNLLD